MTLDNSIALSYAMPAHSLLLEYAVDEDNVIGEYRGLKNRLMRNKIGRSDMDAESLGQ